MAGTEEIARLAAVLEADIKRFESGMTKAQREFDRRAAAIERRQNTLVKRMNTGFAGIGKTLIAGGALFALQRFVSNVSKMADELANTSERLGVGTDEIQSWGILAARAGVKQEAFNTALERFGKNLGEAALKGGNARREFEAIGVNVGDTVTEAFYDFADAVAATADPQQRLALVTKEFGRGAAGLVPVLAQGSAALRAQQEEFRRTGKIMTSEAITKIDDLADRWNELKRQFTAIGGNVLAGFADSFSQFADNVESPAFQQAMREFGQTLGQITSFAVKLSPYLDNIVGALIGLRTAGPIGAGLGAIAPEILRTQTQGTSPEVLLRQIEDVRRQLENAEKTGGAPGLVAQLQKRVATLQAQLLRTRAAAAGIPLDSKRPAAGAPASTLGTIDRAGQLDFSKIEGVDITPLNQDLEDLFHRLEEQERLWEELRGTADDYGEARRQAIMSETAALVILSEGTAQYFDVLREAAEERAQLEEAAINASLERELQRLEDVKNQALAEGVVWEEYEEARVNATLAAEALIRAARVQAAVERKQITEAETQALQHAIRLNDAMRGGLEDIALAARHGFGAMKEAAANALATIADMIVQMYVLKPLLDGLFGPSGTAGGGLLGSLFGGFFAQGGMLRRGQWGIVGEQGPEAIYSGPSGTRIFSNNSMPKFTQALPSRPSLQLNVNNANSFAGAVDADSIRRYADQVGTTSATAAIKTIRQAFPGMMIEAQKRHL